MAASRTTTVTVPIVVERDEDGVWCACAAVSRSGRPWRGSDGAGSAGRPARGPCRPDRGVGSPAGAVRNRRGL